MCLCGCYTEYNICKSALFYAISGVNKDDPFLHPLRRDASQGSGGYYARRKRKEEGDTKTVIFSPAFFSGHPDLSDVLRGERNITDHPYDA